MKVVSINLSSSQAHTRIIKARVRSTGNRGDAVVRDQELLLPTHENVVVLKWVCCHMVIVDMLLVSSSPALKLALYNVTKWVTYI